MKYSQRFVAGALTAFALLSSTPQTHSMQVASRLNLTVKVTGARNAKGKIRAALFSGPQGFPSETGRSIQTQLGDIDPSTKTANLTFSKLPEGTYAIILYHDENMNNKLDTDMMGIPKEGYASSNNPRMRLGPPDYNESKFKLATDGQHMEIRLMY